VGEAIADLAHPLRNAYATNLVTSLR